MTNRIERLRIIDMCLRDKSRLNTWQNLARACADYFEEKTGKYQEVSRRTIMGDIALMRSGRLGYEAPIDYNRHRGYYYTDDNFSIHKLSLSGKKIKVLTEAISILKQITSNERLFKIHECLVFLEKILHMKIDPNEQPVIYFERSLNEKGINWLDVFFENIIAKRTLVIKYQAFFEDMTSHVFSPAFLKEYNNRWYVFGYDFKKKTIINLALDRVKEVRHSVQEYFLPKDFSHDEWCKNLFGVTRMADAEPLSIRFETSETLTPYMDTKPIHTSQKKINQQDGKSVYELYVYDNYEIRSKLLSFGKDLKVLSPDYFRDTLEKMK